MITNFFTNLITILLTKFLLKFLLKQIFHEKSIKNFGNLVEKLRLLFTQQYANLLANLDYLGYYHRRHKENLPA